MQKIESGKEFIIYLGPFRSCPLGDNKMTFPSPYIFSYTDSAKVHIVG